MAVEGGYQWSALAWRPLIRIGAFQGSGDEDPADERYETFFELLPTVRKYSLTASYNLMNSIDLFAQFSLRPRAPLTLGIDLHRVGLTEPNDRWYFGAGATQERGTIFGYGARVSHGSTNLGTVIQGSGRYDFGAHWSVNGFLGLIKEGQVVRDSFDGDTLSYGYLENAVRF